MMSDNIAGRCYGSAMKAAGNDKRE